MVKKRYDNDLSGCWTRGGVPQILHASVATQIQPKLYLSWSEVLVRNASGGVQQLPSGRCGGCTAVATEVFRECQRRARGFGADPALTPLIPPQL